MIDLVKKYADLVEKGLPIDKVPDKYRDAVIRRMEGK